RSARIHDTHRPVVVGDEDTLRLRVKCRTVGILAYRRRGNQLAGVAVEYHELLIAARGKQAMMLRVEREPRWLLARCYGPRGERDELLRVEYVNATLLLVVHETAAAPVELDLLELASPESHRRNDRTAPGVDD